MISIRRPKKGIRVASGVRWRRGHTAVAVLIGLQALGCGGRPGRITPPSISPSRAAEQAITLYDKDGDGRLSATEVQACPAVSTAIQLYDTDGDKSVSKQEVADRLQKILDENNGLLMLHAIVTMDKKPLAGAKVMFVPDPLLEGAISSGSCVTDESGSGIPAISEADFPSSHRYARALQPGVYRVEITHDSVQIPARYNTKTELGADVSYRLMNSGMHFDMVSK